MQTFCCAVIVTIISFFSLTTITNANNEGHRQQYTSYQYDNNKSGLHRTLRRLTRQNRRLKSTVKQKNRQIKQLRQYKDQSVQLGPRPFFLVDDMDEGPLKTTLQQCSSGPFYKTDFSIGHRGAALQFPEHTRESFMAAAKMGAGILECDVTFTKDRELVCRHSQCDLHTIAKSL